VADTDEHAQIAKDFHAAVNMTPSELESWLKTEDSKSVGWAGGEAKSSPGGKESVGHQSGEHIIRIKRKKAADLNADDYAHMKKVVGYVRRHMAQKPLGDVEHTRWRYSLMNWGHDPLKH
jgi:ribosomal protein L11